MFASRMSRVVLAIVWIAAIGCASFREEVLAEGQNTETTVLAQVGPAPFPSILPQELTPPAATAAPASPASASPAPSTPAPVTPETPPAAADVAEQVTKEGLDQLKGRIDSTTELTEAQRQLANELVEKARTLLNQSLEATASLKNWGQRTENLGTERQAEQERADAVARRTPIPQNSYLPLPELEQTFATRQQELVQAQTELTQAEKRFTDRAARQRAIKERMSLIPVQQEKLKSELTRAASAADPTVVAEARRQATLAELKYLDNDSASLQAEAAFLTAQEAANLLSLRRQTLNAVVARLKEEVDELQQQVLRARSSDARIRAKNARDQADAASLPELKEIFESNAQAVETEITIRQLQRRVADEVTRTKVTQETVQRQWDELRQREKSLSSSTSFGIRLREQRRFLPAITELKQEIWDRAETYEQAQLHYIQAREDRSKLDHLNQAIDQMVEQLGPSDDEERRRLSEDVRIAYEQRQKDLAELESVYESYVTGLDQLDTEQSALIQQVTGFHKYIDERILWVPTHRPLMFSDLVADADSLKQLISPERWLGYANGYLHDLQQNPVIYLLAITAWLGLVVTQPLQRRLIKRFGEQASNRLIIRMAPTSGALFWTVVKSLVIPLPLFFLAWRGEQPESTTMEMTGGLRVLGVWVFWLEAMRLSCRKYGLGIAHFQWPVRACEVAYRLVSTFVVITIPLALTVILLRSQSSDGASDAIQRLFSVIYLLVVAFILQRLVSKKKGIFFEWFASRPGGGWTSVLATLLQGVAILLPLFLVGLVIAGFTFAQAQLTVRLGQTLMLIFSAMFVRGLLFRWLTLRQRRLAIARAREMREALSNAQGQEEGTSAAVLEAQEARSNLVDVSAQSKRLLNTTIVTSAFLWVWLIWADVLPAFQRFDQFSVPGLPLTLDKPLVAILEIILFTTAARNIPGLVEMTLLERLPLDRSSRYATGAILRYVIALVAVLVVGNTLGVQWQSLQWLVAALTFSLGFGLQEIFANFVSGLIILFEQPIRVGDVVTLDNVTGTVSRIRIRSTSIIDYDRREYIVPNKEFITGKVLNWTLSDTVNRVLIEIQTSHDADPNQVREILRKIIATQPHVLTDPAPFVNCSKITENGMSFNVGVYLPSMEFRSETFHTIFARVYQAFRENGIELANPQRELHVRTSIPFTLMTPHPSDLSPVTIPNGRPPEPERPQPAKTP